MSVNPSSEEHTGDVMQLTQMDEITKKLDDYDKIKEKTAQKWFEGVSLEVKFNSVNEKVEIEVIKGGWLERAIKIFRDKIGHLFDSTKIMKDSEAQTFLEKMLEKCLKQYTTDLDQVLSPENKQLEPARVSVLTQTGRWLWLEKIEFGIPIEGKSELEEKQKKVLQLTKEAELEQNYSRLPAFFLKYIGRGVKKVEEVISKKKENVIYHEYSTNIKVEAVNLNNLRTKIIDVKKEQDTAVSEIKEELDKLERSKQIERTDTENSNLVESFTKVVKLYKDANNHKFAILNKERLSMISRRINELLSVIENILAEPKIWNKHHEEISKIIETDTSTPEPTGVIKSLSDIYYKHLKIQVIIPQADRIVNESKLEDILHPDFMRAVHIFNSFHEAQLAKVKFNQEELNQMIKLSKIITLSMENGKKQIEEQKNRVLERISSPTKGLNAQKKYTNLLNKYCSALNLLDKSKKALPTPTEEIFNTAHANFTQFIKNHTQSKILESFKMIYDDNEVVTEFSELLELTRLNTNKENRAEITRFNELISKYKINSSGDRLEYSDSIHRLWINFKQIIDYTSVFNNREVDDLAKNIKDLKTIEASLNYSIGNYTNNKLATEKMWNSQENQEALQSLELKEISLDKIDTLTAILSKNKQQQNDMIKKYETAAKLHNFINLYNKYVEAFDQQNNIDRTIQRHQKELYSMTEKHQNEFTTKINNFTLNKETIVSEIETRYKDRKKNVQEAEIRNRKAYAAAVGHSVDLAEMKKTFSSLDLYHKNKKDIDGIIEFMEYTTLASTFKTTNLKEIKQADNQGRGFERFRKLTKKFASSEAGQSDPFLLEKLWSSKERLAFLEKLDLSNQKGADNLKNFIEDVKKLHKARDFLTLAQFKLKEAEDERDNFAKYFSETAEFPNKIKILSNEGEAGLRRIKQEKEKIEFDKKATENRVKRAATKKQHELYKKHGLLLPEEINQVENQMKFRENYFSNSNKFGAYIIEKDAKDIEVEKCIGFYNDKSTAKASLQLVLKILKLSKPDNQYSVSAEPITEYQTNIFTTRGGRRHTGLPVINLSEELHIAIEMNKQKIAALQEAQEIKHA